MPSVLENLTGRAVFCSAAAMAGIVSHGLCVKGFASRGDDCFSPGLLAAAIGGGSWRRQKRLFAVDFFQIKYEFINYFG